MSQPALGQSVPRHSHKGAGQPGDSSVFPHSIPLILVNTAYTAVLSTWVAHMEFRRSSVKEDHLEDCSVQEHEAKETKVVLKSRKVGGGRSLYTYT